MTEWPPVGQGRTRKEEGELLGYALQSWRLKLMNRFNWYRATEDILGLCCARHEAVLHDFYVGKTDI